MRKLSLCLSLVLSLSALDPRMVFEGAKVYGQTPKGGGR